MAGGNGRLAVKAQASGEKGIGLKASCVIHIRKRRIIRRNAGCPGSGNYPAPGREDLLTGFAPGSAQVKSQLLRAQEHPLDPGIA